MAELENKEKKIRGVSAASNAVNAIKEMLRPERVIVKSSGQEKLKQNEYKDHQLTSVDKLMGGVHHNNGVLFRGGKVVVIFFVLFLILIFVKINSLISEIPIAVEKKVKVSEALVIQGGGSSLVSSVVKDAGHEPAEDDRKIIKNLRGQVEQLQSELSQYKQLVTGMNISASLPVFNETIVVPTLSSSIGGVRVESQEEKFRNLRESLGVVRSN